jgi:hypothetical protein
MDIMDFYIEPSNSNLKNAIQKISMSSDPETWSFLANKTPWPLGVHLVKAKSKTQLFATAKQIKDNFGDTDQWIILEKKWRNNGISLEELLNPLFDSEVTLISVIRELEVSGGEDRKISNPVLNHLTEYLVNSTSDDVINTLLSIISFYGTCKGGLNSLDPSLLKSKIKFSQRDWFDRHFVIKLEKLSPELLIEFIEFYDCLGQLPKLYFSNQDWEIKSVPLGQILKAFAEDSKKLGLLRLAGFWCAAGRQASISQTVLAPLDKFQEPKYRLAAMLVRMSQRDFLANEAEQMSEQLAFVTGDNCEPQVFVILVSALEHHAKETMALEIVLRKLLEIIPEDKWQLRARAETLRLTLLQAKPSGFDDSKLKKLNLPLTSF